MNNINVNLLTKCDLIYITRLNIEYLKSNIEQHFFTAISTKPNRVRYN